MKSSLRPLLLAIIVTLIIQGITYLLPDMPSEASIEPSDTSSLLTGTSDNKELIETINEQLNLDLFLKTLPFTVNPTDKTQLQENMKLVASALSKNDKDKAITLLTEMNTLLKPYWFQRETKKQLLAFELYEHFMIEEDYERLKTHQEKIMSMDTASTTESLFKEMSLFIDDYYRSLNHILILYRDEMNTKQVMMVKALENGQVLKINQLTEKPDYNYESFLMSRAFEISHDDMNDLYYVYNDYKKTSKKEFHDRLFKRLAPYWLEENTLKSFIPIEVYKATIYTFLSDDKRLEINKIYQTIEGINTPKEAGLLIQNMIDYNDALKEALMSEYIKLESEFDLRRFIEDDK